ncbi:hypothetical protein ACI797_04195 [Geodermatophilus sp. SYSU D00691]
MSMLTDDVTDAARLIALGMRPKQIPARDLDYADLVRRYTQDEEFADLVTAVADGLGLTILDVTVGSGLVAGPCEESVFEVRMDDYAKRSVLSDRRADRVIHGLAHLAAAALAFPRPEDLANDTYVGYVSVDDVDAAVRETCRVLAERAAAAGENADPLESAPDLERAWRAYARRGQAGGSKTGGTKDGRAASDSSRGAVAKALRYLTDQGMLTARNDDRGGSYRTTPRYQIQVRELAANTAYRQLLDLGVITVPDPSGTLHPVAPTL